MTTAFMFPGQGSQVVGMGGALSEASPAARRTFDEADAILGFALSRLCFSGPESELTATWNAQPALLVASVAAFRAGSEDLLWSLPSGGPSFVAGHSLGEYSALVIAGSLAFDDALRLVRTRGDLMHRCGIETPSTMAAILGLDETAVAALCLETGVEIANVNAPGQIGISGEKAAVELAATLAKSRGARRVLPLNVSAAFHSSLMKPAAEGFAAAIADIRLHDSRIPLITNVGAEPITSSEAIRRELVDQLCKPVLWQKTVECLVQEGVTRLLEIGTGTVLTGLAKRIAPGLEAANPAEAALAKTLR